MGAYIDAPAGQNLFGDAAGNAQRSRQAAGKVAAAPHIRLAAPLYPGSVVRMGGPGLVGKLTVIRGVLVAVFNDGAQRRAAGDAVFQAREENGCVRFLPQGGQGALPRLTAVQEGVQGFQVNGFSGGQAVHIDADGSAVGLAEDRHP